MQVRRRVLIRCWEPATGTRDPAEMMQRSHREACGAAREASRVARRAIIAPKARTPDRLYNSTGPAPKHLRIVLRVLASFSVPPTISNSTAPALPQSRAEKQVRNPALGFQPGAALQTTQTPVSFQGPNPGACNRLLICMTHTTAVEGVTSCPQRRAAEYHHQHIIS
jgi:hypothetical protein